MTLYLTLLSAEPHPPMSTAPRARTTPTHRCCGSTRYSVGHGVCRDRRAVNRAGHAGNNMEETVCFIMHTNQRISNEINVSYQEVYNCARRSARTRSRWSLIQGKHIYIPGIRYVINRIRCFKKAHRTAGRYSIATASSRQGQQQYESIEFAPSKAWDDASLDIT